MKKIFLIIYVLFVSVISFAQTNVDVMVVFNNINQFTNQFNNKENSKEYDFKVKNLSDADYDLFVNKIKSYRGVEDFTLSQEVNGERTAHLKLYKYADHWKYYEYLFSKNGIYRIKIGQNEYNPAQIGNL